MLIRIYRTMVVISCECFPSSALSAWGATELAIWRLSQGFLIACSGSDGSGWTTVGSLRVSWCHESQTLPAICLAGYLLRMNDQLVFHGFPICPFGNSDDPCSGDPNASLSLHINQQTFRFDFKSFDTTSVAGDCEVGSNHFFRIYAWVLVPVWQLWNLNQESEVQQLVT